MQAYADQLRSTPAAQKVEFLRTNQLERAEGRRSVPHCIELALCARRRSSGVYMPCDEHVRALRVHTNRSAASRSMGLEKVRGRVLDQQTGEHNFLIPCYATITLVQTPQRASSASCRIFSSGVGHLNGVSYVTLQCGNVHANTRNVKFQTVVCDVASDSQCHSHRVEGGNDQNNSA